MRRILIAAAVLVVVSVAFWLTQHKEDTETRRQREESILLSFDLRQVSAIVLAVGGRDWRFSKSGGAWRLVDPLADAANPTAVEDLLTAMVKAPITQVIDPPDRLSDYGLDPPAAIVRLEGVRAPLLMLGDAVPTNDGLFARLEGRSGVLVVDIVLGRPLLHPDPARLRDARLPGMRTSTMRGIEISSGTRRTRLVLEADGWWIAEPARLPASDTQVQRLLSALEKARVRRFEDGAKADAALGFGARSVRLVLSGEGGSRTIDLGGDAGTDLRYATRDDRETVMVVEGEHLNDIQPDPGQFGPKQLTRANRYKVTQFRYRVGDRVLEAVRVGENTWKDSAGRPLPEETVLRLLASLLGSQVSGWSAAAVGATPAASLDFEIEGGQRDRIDLFPSNEARLGSAPDVVFRLTAPPPPIPDLS